MSKGERVLKGTLPLIRRCGATFPQGGRQGVRGVGDAAPYRVRTHKGEGLGRVTGK